MSENPVNPVIHGPLWATKTKTALNDCKIKVEAREKTSDHCTLYKVPSVKMGRWTGKVRF